MQIITTALEMRALSDRLVAAGRRIGFVPTMGYLHRGHTSLMELTRPRCDVLVTSIYVNPLQFLPSEDLQRYPRDPEGDTAKCAAAGCDVVFMPDTLYPPGFCTKIQVEGLTTRWEGEARPGHFDGVATVVCRLFGVVRPHVATFGEKDFQQLQVINAMVRDLALPVEILPGPLVRDDDGLALSSRNVYLSPAQRQRALSLHRALAAMAAHPSPVAEERLAVGRAMIEADSIDYLTIVDPETLEPIKRVVRPARAMVTARYGPTRLLDNREILPV